MDTYWNFRRILGVNPQLTSKNCIGITRREGKRCGFVISRSSCMEAMRLLDRMDRTRRFGEACQSLDELASLLLCKRYHCPGKSTSQFYEVLEEWDWSIRHRTALVVEEERRRRVAVAARRDLERERWRSQHIREDDPVESRSRRNVNRPYQDNVVHGREQFGSIANLEDPFTGPRLGNTRSTHPENSAQPTVPNTVLFALIIPVPRPQRNNEPQALLQESILAEDISAIRTNDTVEVPATEQVNQRLSEDAGFEEEPSILEDETRGNGEVLEENGEENDGEPQESWEDDDEEDDDNDNDNDEEDEDDEALQAPPVPTEPIVSAFNVIESRIGAAARASAEIESQLQLAEAEIPAEEPVTADPAENEHQLQPAEAEIPVEEPVTAAPAETEPPIPATQPETTTMAAEEGFGSVVVRPAAIRYTSYLPPLQQHGLITPPESPEQMFSRLETPLREAKPLTNFTPTRPQRQDPRLLTPPAQNPSPEATPAPEQLQDPTCSDTRLHMYGTSSSDSNDVAAAKNDSPGCFSRLRHWGRRMANKVTPARTR